MAEAARFALLPRLGIEPTVQVLVREALDEAITEAEGRRPTDGVTALDAGCGRVSALRQFRPRVGRMVGADIHAPSAPLPHLDEFAIVDLCGPADAFPAANFDVAAFRRSASVARTAYVPSTAALSRSLAVAAVEAGA